MEKTAKQRANDRVEAARGRVKIAGLKPRPRTVAKPSKELVFKAKIANILERLVSKKTDVTVNVPEQKAADPQISVNVPENKQIKPSIHINVPEQKEQPAPIVNVRVPTQQPPNIKVEATKITFPENQLANEWDFTIHRLDNGLISSISAKRIG